MDLIPKQVFSNLGYDKGDESDMKSLEKRYAKKSYDDIVKISAKVVKMRREKKPYWLISYAVGLPVETCKKLVAGTYFDSKKNDNENRVKNSILVSKASILKMENGAEIWKKIQKKEFPYHHVYETKLKSSGKMYFLKAEFEMAYYFDQKKKPITSSEQYKKLDFYKRAKVRYELEKDGVDITTYKRQSLVDEDVLSAVDAIAMKVMHTPPGKAGRPRKQK